MNPVLRSMRLGVARGWIEFNQLLRSPQDMIWTIMISAIFILVLWFQRDAKVDGMSLSLLTLPSLLGMSIAFGGFAGTAGTIAADREDGTLLRAKAIPQGMVAYFVSRIVTVILSTLLSLTILFIPSVLLIDGLTGIGMVDVLTFFWLFFLGLMATAPIGAIIGAIVKTAGSGFGLTFLPMSALVAISGIFYPFSAVVGWLQVVAQIFPVYWLGLGARSVFLPDSAALAEIGGSWRGLETFVVLAIWAVIGLVFAPRILRRAARRVSGSDMQARKEQVMQRGY